MTQEPQLMLIYPALLDIDTKHVHTLDPVLISLNGDYSFLQEICISL